MIDPSTKSQSADLPNPVYRRPSRIRVPPLATGDEFRSSTGGRPVVETGRLFDPTGTRHAVGFSFVLGVVSTERNGGGRHPSCQKGMDRSVPRGCYSRRLTGQRSQDRKIVGSDQDRAADVSMTVGRMTRLTTQPMTSDAKQPHHNSHSTIHLQPQQTPPS